MIHIIGREVFETGRSLARVLGASFGPNRVLGKYNVAWGYGFGNSELNHNAVTDKLKQLQVLKEKDIPVPEVLWTITYLTDIHRVVRMLGNDVYPILARNRRHTQGKDIVFINNARRLYRDEFRVLRREFLVKYINKTREFRVHVLGGRWVSISEKVHDNTGIQMTERQKYIWCHKNGYNHVVLSEFDELRPIVGSLATKACKALNFDFGAVDIILGEDGNLYVLEINSAPCLNERRLEMYAKFIKESYENSWEVNKREA